MSSTAIAPRKDEWRVQLRAMEQEFGRALPPHIPAERFIRATETAISRDRQLIQCNRQSLLEAIMQSAETGLMPNGRDAALVRYKDKVQFIPMIGGILRLMRNSGEVQTIISEVVCENDVFEYRLGDDPHIHHIPAEGERGVLTRAYAILKTKDGGVYREVMTRSEIDKVRGCSRAQSGPWQTWYEEMARKTVLRRLAKKCPLSTDHLMDLASRDDNMYDLSAAAAADSVSQIDEMRARLSAVSSDEIPSQVIDIEDDLNQDSEPAAATIHVDEDEAALDPVYGSQSEALAELESVIKDLGTAPDIDAYQSIWRDYVIASFTDPVAKTVTQHGNAIILARKKNLK